MEYTESLPPPPGTHEACRLPQSLAYEAQVWLTLAWPGWTESQPVICRPIWPLANTAYDFFCSVCGAVSSLGSPGRALGGVERGLRGRIRSLFRLSIPQLPASGWRFAANSCQL